MTTATDIRAGCGPLGERPVVEFVGPSLPEAPDAEEVGNGSANRILRVSGSRSVIVDRLPAHDRRASTHRADALALADEPAPRPAPRSRDVLADGKASIVANPIGDFAGLRTLAEESR